MWWVWSGPHPGWDRVNWSLKNGGGAVNPWSPQLRQPWGGPHSFRPTFFGVGFSLSEPFNITWAFKDWLSWPWSSTIFSFFASLARLCWVCQLGDFWTKNRVQASANLSDIVETTKSLLCQQCTYHLLNPKRKINGELKASFNIPDME